MKRLLTLGLLAMFGAAIVGCEASARVGDDDKGRTRTEVKRDDGSYYEKKTVKTDDGRRTVETKIERD